jgi:monoamine oxidase
MVIKPSEVLDVVVIGAGAAGLAAGAELGRAGLSVGILEARERIGGRILTLRDPATTVPIEMGAEFIHGLPPEIWTPLLDAKVRLSEVTGEAWCHDAHLLPYDFTNNVDQILKLMDDEVSDQSFWNFLAHCCPGPGGTRQQEAKKRALAYVMGFNAADPELVGVHWLVKGMREEEMIEGYRAFRAANGYEDLIQIFRYRLQSSNVSVITGAAISAITWNPSGATISTEDGSSTYQARQVVVSVPLSILKLPVGQKGAIEFNPALPPEKLTAMSKLEMGKVIRLVLRFRDRFWDSVAPPKAHGRNLSDMSFLFSDDEWFPTWWTTMPVHEPIIIGWAPFQCAERLSGRDRSFVVDRGLKTLSGLLAVSLPNLEEGLEGAYFHDWQCDPYSRGAYSYGMVGADGAQEVLAKPVDGILFFAGEATASPGSNGTVHGAIASGYRAAREILSLRRERN